MQFSFESDAYLFDNQGNGNPIAVIRDSSKGKAAVTLTFKQGLGTGLRYATGFKKTRELEFAEGERRKTLQPGSFFKNLKTQQAEMIAELSNARTDSGEDIQIGNGTASVIIRSEAVPIPTPSSKTRSTPTTKTQVKPMNGNGNEFDLADIQEYLENLTDQIETLKDLVSGRNETVAVQRVQEGYEENYGKQSLIPDQANQKPLPQQKLCGYTEQYELVKRPHYAQQLYVCQDSIPPGYDAYVEDGILRCIPKGSTGSLPSTSSPKPLPSTPTPSRPTSSPSPLPSTPTSSPKPLPSTPTPSIPPAPPPLICPTGMSQGMAYINGAWKSACIPTEHVAVQPPAGGCPVGTVPSVVWIDGKMQAACVLEKPGTITSVGWNKVNYKNGWKDNTTEGYGPVEWRLKDGRLEIRGSALPGVTHTARAGANDSTVIFTLPKTAVTLPYTMKADGNGTYTGQGDFEFIFKPTASEIEVTAHAVGIQAAPVFFNVSLPI